MLKSKCNCDGYNDVIKKEYVFTLKCSICGKIFEKREEISLYASHRSCITDFDKRIEESVKEMNDDK